MVFTAVMAVPLGIAAALYLEEFANKERWYNRFIEVNLQNLAAVPSIVYGLLAVAAMALIGFQQTGIVLGGAIALALLILPGHHHHHPRGGARGAGRDPARLPGARAPPCGRPPGARPCPSAIPGIATGTILGLSRAIGEAAPLVVVGLAGSVRFDPTGVLSQITALPMQIYSLTSQSQEEFREAASAAIIVLLIMILGFNGLAIFIRNKFQRTW